MHEAHVVLPHEPYVDASARLRSRPSTGLLMWLQGLPRELSLDGGSGSSAMRGLFTTLCPTVARQLHAAGPRMPCHAGKEVLTGLAVPWYNLGLAGCRHCLDSVPGWPPPACGTGPVYHSQHNVPVCNDLKQKASLRVSSASGGCGTRSMKRDNFKWPAG